MKDAKAKLRKEILAEIYKDMEALINGVVWDFWRIHGGDVEDLRAQANLIVVRAIDKYNPKKAKLSTWIAVSIKRWLFDYITRTPESKHISIDAEFAEIQATPSAAFSVLELLDEMSKDAHIVLWLFLTTPKEVLLDAVEEKRRHCEVCRYLRNRLQNRLRQMGWERVRILEAFNEIKSVISY
ncbi:MAG: sigma factor [Candidatus Methanofastidiosia archaeon]